MLRNITVSDYLSKYFHMKYTIKMFNFKILIHKIPISKIILYLSLRYISEHIKLWINKCIERPVGIQ